jgi:hypothetical protein
MQQSQKLHQRLLNYACETSGWQRNKNASGWRKAVAAMLVNEPWTEEREDVLGCMSDLRARPDAWKLSIDDEGFMVIEFLEIEVSHHISEDKKVDYQKFYWRIDGSDGVILRIWRMDRWASLPHL